MSRLPDRDLKRIMGRAMRKRRTTAIKEKHYWFATAERHRDGEIRRKAGERVSATFRQGLTYEVVPGSEDDGEQWFETTWETFRRRVCRNWKLCEKARKYETQGAFVAAIIGFLMKQHRFVTDDEIGIAFAIMLWRKGPEMMCDC
jgi:hypothetical protein